VKNLLFLKKKKQKDFYSLGITINPPSGGGLSAALAQPPKKKACTSCPFVLYHPGFA
jgi:hypothetical protein